MSFRKFEMERSSSWSISDQLSNANTSTTQGNNNNVFRTPNFRAMPNNFVARRSSCSRSLDLSPIPDNFASVADEDLWLQLNNGCTTNLDTLEFDSSTSDSRSSVAKEEHAALERECGRLKEDKAALVEALEMSKQDAEMVKAEKEGLAKDLSAERRRLRELKEEIRLFSVAFAQREGLLASLYARSKAVVGNLDSSRAPVPKPFDC